MVCFTSARINCVRAGDDEDEDDGVHVIHRLKKPGLDILPHFGVCDALIQYGYPTQYHNLTSSTFVHQLPNLQLQPQKDIQTAAMARLPESAGSSPSRSLFFNSFGTPSAKDVAQNPQVVHEALLDAALREHNRVRDSAIRTFNNNQMRETQLKLLQEEKQEKERLRLEQALADDRARVIELRKKKIPIPELPPREKTPPPPVTPVAPVQKPPIPAALPPQAQPQPQLQQPQLQPQQVAAQAVTQAAPAQPLKPIQPTPTTAPQQLPPQPPIGAPTARTVKVSIPSDYISQPNILPGTKKYEEIHQNLKRLRHFIVEAGKNDPALKKKTGEMRREIRKSVGQLTSGKGATLVPVSLNYIFFLIATNNRVEKENPRCAS
jgi:nucleoporin GLE1